MFGKFNKADKPKTLLGRNSVKFKDFAEPQRLYRRLFSRLLSRYYTYITVCKKVCKQYVKKVQRTD